MATTNTRKVTITTLNWIPQLGMNGPIIYPRYINEDIIYKVVRSGFEVFEHCTSGQYAGTKIKLTVSNFYDKNRFAPEVAPVKTAAQTVKNFGAAVNGQAKVVASETKSAAVPVANTEVSASEVLHTVPKVATPINSTMSRSQRRKAAKAAAAAAKAAQAAQETASEPEQVLDPSNTTVTEEPVETVTETAESDVSETSAEEASSETIVEETTEDVTEEATSEEASE